MHHTLVHAHGLVLKLQAAPEEGQFEDADEDEGDEDGATPDCACCRQR